MMSSCSLRFSFRIPIPKVLPYLSPTNPNHNPNPNHQKFSVSSSSSSRSHHNKHKLQLQACTNKVEYCTSRILGVAVQVGGLLATVAEPALAVTGVDEGEDLVWILIQSAISAFLYFIVAPPIIMNWLRIRWYKRNLVEMYFQFMFVFLFFPGIVVWAPFLNFRKFPRDPAMKYPWSVPQNPSEIRGGFLKYPWAKPEDYE